MSKIYIVVCNSGDYDDYRKKNIAAFHDENVAKGFCDDCQKEANRICEACTKIEKSIPSFEEQQKQKMTYEETMKYWNDIHKIVKSHKYDPDFEWNEPIKYEIEEMEIQDGY